MREILLSIDSFQKLNRLIQQEMRNESDPLEQSAYIARLIDQEYARQVSQPNPVITVKEAVVMGEKGFLPHTRSGKIISMQPLSLERLLKELRNDFLYYPRQHAVIMAARYLITEYDRDLLPDWIEALANANTDNMQEVVEEVREEMLSEV